MLGFLENNQNFFLIQKKKIYETFLLYLINLTLQDVKIRYVQRHVVAGVRKTECQAKLLLTSQICSWPHFLIKRAIKSFSGATHLSRGIILNIGKVLRRSTNNAYVPPA